MVCFSVYILKTDYIFRTVYLSFIVFTTYLLSDRIDRFLFCFVYFFWLSLS